MWRTSCGNRTLYGAEARLFAEALLSLLDEAESEQLYDYDLGPLSFDRLTYGQKIAVLSTVADGLLRDDVPAVPLTAVLEGAIAAVFEHLRNLLAFEVEEDTGTLWRNMIVAARQEMKGVGVPRVTCRDHNEWDCEIQELSDCILWDADYECGDLFLDQPPEHAEFIHRELRIPEGYFTAIAEDLTDQQAEDRVAEIRKLCVAVVGE